MVDRGDALRALLTSEARARLLAALFATPERRWYQRELARETDLPITAVQRELRRLVAAGFLVESREAGRHLYAPDPRSSVFRELQAIVLKLRGPVVTIRQALAGARGIRLAWVFGSFASGTASAFSDLDLMILGTTSARSVRSHLAAVERMLGRTINEHVMTEEEWRRRLGAHDGFLREVRHVEKVWVVGDDAALAKLDPKGSR